MHQTQQFFEQQTSYSDCHFDSKDKLKCLSYYFLPENSLFLHKAQEVNKSL